MKDIERKLKKYKEDIEVISLNTYPLKKEYRTILKIKIGHLVKTIIKSDICQRSSLKKATGAAQALVYKIKGVNDVRV